MEGKISGALIIMPTVDLGKTAKYYCDQLGFRAVECLTAEPPHICLYRDAVEIVLTHSNRKFIEPNRKLHGAGYDGYFISEDVQALYDELKAKGVKIVREYQVTSYGNREFVFEDIDGRWVAVGIKQA